DGGDAPVHESADGFGREYGVAVHHLFESLVSRRKSEITDEFLEQDAVSVLEAETVGPSRPEHVDAAVRAGKGLITSDLWPRIVASDRVLTEVPFTVSFERDGVDEVLSGVVDLAFHADGAWMLVDYKTDRHAPETLAVRYGRQVSAYADAWRAIFPNESVSIAIWSAEHDLLVPIETSRQA
ncbi:MAG: hypothetical protein HKN17_11390, partial [Rhodothermales bacterium]|nr:hypothetical protein [Rhodothermales bacterium]